MSDLKVGKVDKNINKLNLQALEFKIADVRKDVDNINSYGKWIVLLIGATILTAIMTAITTGKLK